MAKFVARAAGIDVQFERVVAPTVTADGAIRADLIMDLVHLALHVERLAHGTHVQRVLVPCQFDRRRIGVRAFTPRTHEAVEDRPLFAAASHVWDDGITRGVGERAFEAEPVLAGCCGERGLW